MLHGKICIDTNVAISLLNGKDKTLRIIDKYHDVLLPIIVAGELRLGAYRSTKISENLVKIDALEMRCEIIDVDSSVADVYGRIKSKLYASGTPIPENDIWIAACCMSVSAPLLSTDAHFKFVESLDLVML
jgi:predicted nucleic acid-binding protein